MRGERGGCVLSPRPVAAHLEHRRHVERPVERTLHGRAQHGDPRARSACAAVGAAALGLGQPPCVLAEDADHARRERSGQSRMRRDTPQGQQQLVRVGGAYDEQAGQRHDEQAQPEDEAVYDGLQREVDLPEHPPFAEPREHGQPAPVDEHVDQHGGDEQRQHARAGGPEELAPDAGAGGGEQHRGEQSRQQDRVFEQQRRERQRATVGRDDGRAGGMERARAAAEGDPPCCVERAHCATGSGCGPVAVTASGEAVAQGGFAQRARRQRDAGRVRPGDGPDRNAFLAGRRGEEAGAGAERSHRATVLVEQRQARPGRVRGRVDAARARPALQRLELAFGAEFAPWTHEHAQQLRAPTGPERAGGGGHARLLQARGDGAARAAGFTRAFDTDGQALAADPVEERLRV